MQRDSWGSLHLIGLEVKLVVDCSVPASVDRNALCWTSRDNVAEMFPVIVNERANERIRHAAYLASTDMSPLP